MLIGSAIGSELLNTLPSASSWSQMGSNPPLPSSGITPNPLPLSPTG